MRERSSRARARPGLLGATRRGVAAALVAANLAVLSADAVLAQACSGGQRYVPLAADAKHPLDWKLLAARPSRASATPGLIGGDAACEGGAVGALREVVRREVAAGALVILGEVHDNSHHHHVRAHLLPEGLSPAPPLVLEHIRVDQKALLDGALAQALGAPIPRDPAPVFVALDWDRSGWPDKALFAPFFGRALDLGMALRAGHPPRDRLRAVAQSGLAALPDDARLRLHGEAPMGERLHAALLGELAASHCGLMPGSAFANMAAAQVYRDAHMAAELIAASGAGGGLLATGNGHARRDRGVPLHLARLAPGRSVLAVLLIEAEPGKTDPETYVPRDPDGQPAADLVLLTPHVARADPCVEMRARFGKRKP